MLSPVESVAESVLVSGDIPVPSCLGDFIKLFGDPAAVDQSCDVGFFANTISASSAYAIDDLKTAISIIRSSMDFSRSAWVLAHREFSQYGIWQHRESEELYRVWEGPISQYRISFLPERADGRLKAAEARVSVEYREQEALRFLKAMWVGIETAPNQRCGG